MIHIKRKLLLSILTLVLTFCFVNSAFAGIPNVYPTYGYSEEENLCKFKQSSAEAVVQENLEGEYWSLGECRRENPKVFLNTGFGIVIWLGIFSLAFIVNFYVYPRFRKKNDLEKHVAFFSDLVGIALILFLIILLEHYFSTPDVDDLIYLNFIRPLDPLLYGLLYLSSVLIRVVWLFLKQKGFSPLHHLRHMRKSVFLGMMALSVLLTGILSLIPFGGGNCEFAEPGGVPESWWGFPLPFYACGVWGQAFHPIFIPINFLFVCLLLLSFYSVFRILKRK